MNDWREITGRSAYTIFFNTGTRKVMANGKLPSAALLPFAALLKILVPTKKKPARRQEGD